MGKHQLGLILTVLILSSIACTTLFQPNPSDIPDPTSTPSPEQGEVTLEPNNTPTPTVIIGGGGGPGDPPEGPPTLTLPAPQIDPQAAIPHLSPSQDFSITFIDMQNSAIGWAIAAASDPSDHILYTRDGGITWKDITPPEAAPTGAESYKIASAFFLDTEYGWVTYSFEEFFQIPEYPIVWYTQDGGATWQPSSFLETRGASMEFYSPSYMQFVDPQNGWLLAAVGSGMSHSYSVLFRTSDGGATWARIIDPFMSDSLHNCCKTGMAFADVSTGLVTSGQGPYTQPFVTWTRDGSLTWLQQPLPEPSSNLNLFDNAFCESHSPHFFDTNAVMVGVSCQQFDDDGSSTEYNYVYTSLDDGDTWISAPAEGSGALFFFDENTGFSLGRDIYFSTDGGLTWALVKTVFWDGQFSFVDRERGWVVALNGDKIAFMSSINGGETWQEIEPKLVE